MASRMTIATLIGRINVSPAAPSGSNTVRAAPRPHAARRRARVGQGTPLTNARSNGSRGGDSNSGRPPGANRHRRIQFVHGAKRRPPTNYSPRKRLGCKLRLDGTLISYFHLPLFDFSKGR